VASPIPLQSHGSHERQAIRTTGPKGSPDYIPRKRGYAPNLPIPARKFRLPKAKQPAWKRGVPTPTVPAEAPRTIKNVGILYDRQLQAMRRGYIEWRLTQHRERLIKRKEAMEKPQPPRPKAFEPTFAERMTTPSNSDQKQLEQLLFGQTTQRKVRGEGWHSPHHQKLVEKERYELITNYLSLYAVTDEMITTYEQLDQAINEAFEDGYTSAYMVEHPPTYEELVEEIEGGQVGTLRGGYMSRRNQDLENEVFNAMLGTVGNGHPGFEEVMEVIQEQMEGEEKQEVGETEKRVAANLEDKVAEEAIPIEGEAAVSPESSVIGSEPAVTEASKSHVIDGDRLTFAPRQVDDVAHPTGIESSSTPNTPGTTAEPSTVESIDVVESGTVTASAATYPTPSDLEYEKELLRERYLSPKLTTNNSYRRGFIKPARRRLPASSTLQPEDPSDLAYPSAIEEELSHNAPRPQRRSIADIAEADNVPKFESQTDILGTSHREECADLEAAKQTAKAWNVSDPFPELKSLDLDDVESLDYLAQREYFEREFPSARVKQPINKEEWAKPTSRNKSFTSETTGGVPEASTGGLESAPVEDEGDGNGIDEQILSTEPSEPRKSILDDLELDPLDRKALEEIRAQRERRRGPSDK
jgi:hypothetical protein